MNKHSRDKVCFVQNDVNCWISFRMCTITNINTRGHSEVLCICSSYMFSGA